MDKELINLLALWKIKADNDLKSISNEFSCKEPVTDVICFHAQQAVEKYLKLFLLSKGNFVRKTHNIGFLLVECRKHDEDFNKIQNIEYLSDYAIELRYANNFFLPSIEEAHEAYNDALMIKRFIENKIELNLGNK